MAFITKLDLSDDRQVKHSIPQVEWRGTALDSMVPPTEITKVTIHSEVIVAEDNSIELNFGGSKQSAVGGGITVLSAISETQNAEFETNENGDWVTNNNIAPKGLIIPFFTPASSKDPVGLIGSITRDNHYIYFKTDSGWKRTNLEIF